jgi:hypothetical protein
MVHLFDSCANSSLHDETLVQRVRFELMCALSSAQALIRNLPSHMDHRLFNTEFNSARQHRSNSFVTTAEVPSSSSQQ